MITIPVSSIQACERVILDAAAVFRLDKGLLNESSEYLTRPINPVSAALNHGDFTAVFKFTRRSSQVMVPH
jgi:hypothetical protein